MGRPSRAGVGSREIVLVELVVVATLGLLTDEDDFSGARGPWRRSRGRGAPSHPHQTHRAIQTVRAGDHIFETSQASDQGTQAVFALWSPFRTQSVRAAEAMRGGPT